MCDLQLLYMEILLLPLHYKALTLNVYFVYAVVNCHLFHSFYCQTCNINIGNIYETILAFVFLLWKIKKKYEMTYKLR